MTQNCGQVCDVGRTVLVYINVTLSGCTVMSLACYILTYDSKLDISNICLLC